MAYGDTPETIAAKNEEARRWVRFGLKITAGVIVGLILLIWGWKYVTPKYNLYRANTEKQAIIKETQARADAARYEAERQVEIARARAEADVIRADGVAEANRLIASSLTPEYVRWYFVDRLDDINGQIIYVPTEAGVPLPEAGRAVEEVPAR
jgi:hypothetical protein